MKIFKPLTAVTLIFVLNLNNIWLINAKDTRCSDQFISTSNGCLECYGCSLDHLNSVHKLIERTNSSEFQLRTAVPFDSWIHVRLRWIGNCIKNYAYDSLILFQQQRSVPKRIHYLHHATDFLAKLSQIVLKSGAINNTKMLTGSNFTEFMAKKTLKRSEEVLEISDFINNALIESVWIFRNISKNLINNCSNSCIALIESGGLQFWKEISVRNFSSPYDKAKKELYAGGSLKKFLKSVFSLKGIAVRSNFRLSRINKNTLKTYRDLALFLANFKTFKLIINPGLSQIIREKLVEIDYKIEKLQIFFQLEKLKIKQLRPNFQRHVQKDKNIATLFANQIDLCRTTLENRRFNLHKLNLLKVRLHDEIPSFVERSDWIYGKLHFASEAIPSYNRTLHKLYPLVTAVSECKKDVQKTKTLLYQINGQIQNILHQLSNIIVQPEEFSFISISSSSPGYQDYYDDEDYQSSGNYKDIINFPIAQVLKEVIENFKTMMTSQKANVDRTQHAIMDKLYELEMLSNIMRNRDKLQFQIRKNMTIFREDVSRFYNGLKKISYVVDVDLSKSTVLIKSSNKIKNQIQNIVKLCETQYKDLKLKRFNWRNQFEQALVKVDNVLLAVSAKKIVAPLKRKFHGQKDLLKSVTEVFAKNKKRVYDNLAAFQVPLNFQSPAYVKLVIPNDVASKSIITTVEFWFKTYNHSAFLFNYGEVGHPGLTFYLQSYCLLVVVNQKGIVKVITTNETLTLGTWHFIEFRWLDDLIEIFSKTGGSKLLKISKVYFDQGVIPDFKPVVYLGGIATYRNYYMLYPRIFNGCLGGLKINGNSINLFSWTLVRGTVNTCSSSPHDEIVKLLTLSFNGNGGLYVRPSNASTSTLPSIEFSVRTVQKDGVIAFFTDRNRAEWLIVKISDGRVVAHFETRNKSQILDLYSEKMYNDGKLHHVKLSPVGKSFVTGAILTVDEIDRAHGAIYNPKAIKNIIYLGTIGPNHLINIGSASHNFNFIGCLLGLKINNRNVNQMSRSAVDRFDLAMSTCPNVLGSCMCLTDTSPGPIRITKLGFKIDTLSFLFSLNTRNVYSNVTVMFYSPSPYSWLEIFITPNDELQIQWEIGTRLGKTKSSKRSTVTGVSKTTWHNFILKNKYTKDNNSSLLCIDDLHINIPMALFSDIRFTAQHLLYLGGRPSNMLKSDFKPHFICYRDFLLNDQLKEFSDYAILNGLELCPSLEERITAKLR